MPTLLRPGRLLTPKMNESGLLFAGGSFRVPMTYTRAQAAGVQAASVSANGIRFDLVGANVPRYDDQQGLLMEPSTTNLFANARTPGSTGWTLTGIPSAAQTTGPDGNPSSAVLLSEGTANSAHLLSTTGSVTAGTNYVFSALVSPGTATLVQVTTLSSGFGGLQTINFNLTGQGSAGTPTAGVLTHGIRRIGDWYLIWASGAATGTTTTAGWSLAFITALTNGRAPAFVGTNRTLRVAWAQMEVGTYPTSFILAPSGTPGTATRENEFLSIPLENLGIGETGLGVYEATVTIPEASPAGITLTIFDVGLDANNRYLARIAAGGTTVAINRVTEGVASGDVAAGTYTPGVPFRVRLRIVGDGTAFLSVNDGAEASVSGGPVVRLNTLRIGNNLGGTTPLRGSLLRSRILTSPDSLRLGRPSGLGWVPPFNVYRSPTGVYSHDFNPERYKVSGKTYYLSPTGNNANDGLSWATAKRSLVHIFDTVTDYDVILVAPGEYDATFGWGARVMSRSASIIAVGGRATFSRRIPSITWVAEGNPGVFLGTPSSATAVGIVVDALYPGPTGQPQRLIRATSLANCVATSGSFWPSGTQVYVHLSDDRTPDANVRGYFAGTNAALASGVNAYFEGLDFVGGNTNFLSSQASAGADRDVVFKDCTFRFSSSGDAVRLDSSGRFYFMDCIAELAELDGLNYREPTGGGVGVRVAEFNTIARWNGYTGSGFNNGSSLHQDTVAISVNCLYENNQNRNVHDVFGGRRWALGCTSRNSRATDASSANWVVGQIPGQSGAGIAAFLWLDGCVSSGSTTDLNVNAACTALTRNTATGGWAITNIGTLGTY